MEELRTVVPVPFWLRAPVPTISEESVRVSAWFRLRAPVPSPKVMVEAPNVTPVPRFREPTDPA